MSAVVIDQNLYCYHCGKFCEEEPVVYNNKSFCSCGCEHIYKILEKNHLLDYYTLTDSPGCCHKATVSTKDFSLLDSLNVQRLFITSTSENEAEAVFYLPEIHCSSCWWLIDNIYKLDKNITSSTVDFSGRKARITYNPNFMTLRQVAELLASVGYEADLSAAEKLYKGCCMGCANSNGNCKGKQAKHFEVML